MAEDLKIVLKAELEADEETSAQRIAAQIPKIAKLVNSKSEIKIGVALDDGNLQGQAQQISRQLKNISSKSRFNMNLDFGADKVDAMAQQLRNLQVPQSAIDDFVAGIDRGAVGITSISTGLSEVGDSAKTVTATIEGVTAAGEKLRQTLSQSFTLNSETEKWESGVFRSVSNVSKNYEQLQKAAENAAKAQEQTAERRQTEATNLASSLDNVKAKYEGLTSATRQVTGQEHLDQLSQKYSEIGQHIQAMKNSSEAYSTTERANIRSEIQELERLSQGFSNAEKAATALRKKSVEEIKVDEAGSLDVLEERLKSAGVLTEQFQENISKLRTELSQVTDRNGITDYFASLSSFTNDVELMKTRMRSLNSVYSDLIANEREQATIQKQLISDTGMSETTRENLESQLLVLQSQHAILESQRASYADIAQYSSQRTKYEQANYNNLVSVANAEAEVAAKAQESDAAMQRVYYTVADLETRMKQVVNPTETLKQNMQLLRETAAQYSSDMGDREKVQTYERLQGLISDCRKEMSELTRVERGEVLDFKFTQGLEKAKADLTTIGRQWSALKSVPGLNAQFQQLSENLRRVDNQMDLNKWTAQFNRFKSEVKAAGKNMLSFADSIKNAASKISQWALGTLSIYGAFNKLKTAVSAIVDLDTAMVDLRKTTNETQAAYEKFYLSANETAKVLGVTTADVISQTAEWSRLGLTR